ncbi:MAG: PrmA [Cyanobacteria bacterium RYN_339]|nr:PrmA [Cyanobacteria bacterium RYN_339]
MDYTEISLRVAPIYAETLAWHLRDLGGQGVVVSEEPAEGPKPAEGAVKLYQPGTPESVTDWVVALETRLGELRPHFPELVWRVEQRLVPSEDWEDSWKRYWHVQEIGERIVIKPSWEEYVGGPEKLVIELDPKQAFGTGTHATTQLCLRSLEEHMQAFDSPFVFDVGTGSGILAIAAAMLGAKRVETCDTDQVAVIATRENADANGVGDRVAVYHGGIETLTGQADVLVINILAEVIVSLADQVAHRLKPGGLVIASGIIKARQASVEAAFEASGLAIARIEHQGEWVLVEARRPDSFVIEPHN